MGRSEDYIVSLAAGGRYHFTTEEAKAALGRSSGAVRAALLRLKRRGKIADPYRGFHLIVPPEYRSLGCLPPEQFIPQLMEHLGRRYYVALLSAAEFHGAAHQRPQSFQVMLATNRRPIACGRVRVRFLARGDLARTPTVEFNTPRGTVRVASAEATALELAGYASDAGGLDNVLSVLSELAEAMVPSKLVAVAKLAPVAWAQRLGYLLDLARHVELADALTEHVREHATVAAALVRRRSMSGAPRAKRWKLAVNAEIEPES